MSYWIFYITSWGLVVTALFAKWLFSKGKVLSIFPLFAAAALVALPVSAAAWGLFRILK